MNGELNKRQIFKGNLTLNEYVMPSDSDSVSLLTIYLSLSVLFAEHGNPIDEKLVAGSENFEGKIKETHTMT